ncbi:MAG TPA: HNH endonuclease [Devosia sp.]|nr:HNH endonuclease [Devosia sp.]
MSNDPYERAFNEAMERAGVPRSSCKVCGAEFFVQCEYQERGVCFECVRILAHEWAMKHTGEPIAPFSTQEQIEEYEANRPRGRQSTPKAAISPALRKLVLERDAYRCQQCGDHHDLHIDHVFPESKGGATTAENLQVLCGPCNLRKGARVP